MGVAMDGWRSAQTRHLLARMRPEWTIVAWGFPISLAWEFAHTPLYADAGGGIGYLLWTRFHCALGDLLILLGAFWMTSLLVRTRFWWMRLSWDRIVTFVGLGLAYTMWSEWFNTRVTGGWTYGDAMPVVLWMGLSPLLQWVVVPSIVLAVLRRREGDRNGG